MSLVKFQKFLKITEIPTALLAESGIKCVMIDMDSTLIVWHGKKVEPEEEKWCRGRNGNGHKDSDSFQRSQRKSEENR